MSEIVSADLDRGPSDGRKSFADEFAKLRERHNGGWQGASPEAVKHRQAVAEDEVSPDLVTAYSVAAEQAARADEAEATAQALYENQLDELYSTPYENLTHSPEDVASAFLTASDGDWRLGGFLAEWGEADPEAADAWIEFAQSRLAEEIVSNQNQQIASVQQDAGRARANAVENFFTRHKLEGTDKGDIVAAFGAAMPGLAEATPAELTQTLEHTLATTEEALRAQQQAEREREIRAAFVQPTFSDIKRNRSPRPEPVVDESSIINRMRPVQTPEERQAAIKARHDEIRRQTMEAGTSRFSGTSNRA